MIWKLSYLPEVDKDFNKIGKTEEIMVRKAISKTLQNPLPMSEGGYGKPLGNRGGSDPRGLLKIKLKRIGIRVVYKVVRTETEMLVIVVGAREDDEVYSIAQARADKYGL